MKTIKVFHPLNGALNSNLDIVPMEQVYCINVETKTEIEDMFYQLQNEYWLYTLAAVRSTSVGDVILIEKDLETTAIMWAGTGSRQLTVDEIYQVVYPDLVNNLRRFVLLEDVNIAINRYWSLHLVSPSTFASTGFTYGDEVYNDILGEKFDIICGSINEVLTVPRSIVRRPTVQQIQWLLKDCCVPFQKRALELLTVVKPAPIDQLEETKRSISDSLERNSGRRKTNK